MTKQSDAEDRARNRRRTNAWGAAHDKSKGKGYKGPVPGSGGHGGGNPYHLPAGSSKGGEFTTGGGGKSAQEQAIEKQRANSVATFKGGTVAEQEAFIQNQRKVAGEDTIVAAVRSAAGLPARNDFQVKAGELNKKLRYYQGMLSQAGDAGERKAWRQSIAATKQKLKDLGVK